MSDSWQYWFLHSSAMSFQSKCCTLDIWSIVVNMGAGGLCLGWLGAKGRDYSVHIPTLAWIHTESQITKTLGHCHYIVGRMNSWKICLNLVIWQPTRYHSNGSGSVCWVTSNLIRIIFTCSKDKLDFSTHLCCFKSPFSIHVV